MPRSWRAWTPEDDQALERFAAGRRWAEAAAALGRDAETCARRWYRRAERARLREQVRVRRWTKADDDSLRRLYGTVSIDDVAEMLNRTADSIRVRAQALGIAGRMKRSAFPKRTASREQRADRHAAAVVAELWRLGESVAEMARAAGVGAAEVRRIVSRLERGRKAREKAAPKPAGAWWTDAEDQQIRDCMDRIGVGGLAERLGRTPDEIRARAAIVGPTPAAAPWWQRVDVND